jgi:hypothetical protein
MIHATNNIMRSLLFQGSIPAHYLAESLYTAAYILNLVPTKAISARTPYFALFGTTPSYAHLRIFGCACYSNTSATAPHKLAPFLSVSSLGTRLIIRGTDVKISSRRLGLPLLAQSCGSSHCSTLPFFCCRYLGDYRHASGMAPTPQPSPHMAPASTTAPRAAPTSTTAPRAALVSMPTPRAALTPTPTRP